MATLNILTLTFIVMTSSMMVAGKAEAKDVKKIKLDGIKRPNDKYLNQKMTKENYKHISLEAFFENCKKEKKNLQKEIDTLVEKYDSLRKTVSNDKDDEFDKEFSVDTKKGLKKTEDKIMTMDRKKKELFNALTASKRFTNDKHEMLLTEDALNRALIRCYKKHEAQKATYIEIAKLYDNLKRKLDSRTKEDPKHISIKTRIENCEKNTEKIQKEIDALVEGFDYLKKKYKSLISLKKKSNKEFKVDMKKESEKTEEESMPMDKEKKEFPNNLTASKRFTNPKHEMLLMNPLDHALKRCNNKYEEKVEYYIHIAKLYDGLKRKIKYHNMSLLRKSGSKKQAF